MNALLAWLIPLLAAAGVAGVVWFMLRALQAGAEEYSNAYTAAASERLEDMFLFIPPRRILELAMALSATCGVIGFGMAGGFTLDTIIRGLLVATLFAWGGWQLPSLILAVMRHRRLGQFNEQLVDALTTMSNALRAGFSIQQSFETIARENRAPISQEFGVFLHETRVGLNMSEAMNNLEARVGSQDLMLMVSAIETARQTGGNLTEVFDRIAHTIRERMRVERRIRTLTAQGRLQGIVVGAMPFLLAFAMSLLDARMMTSFFHSTLGVTICVAVLLLVGCGAMLIRKIVRIDV